VAGESAGLLIALGAGRQDRLVRGRRIELRVVDVVNLAGLEQPGPDLLHDLSHGRYRAMVDPGDLGQASSGLHLLVDGLQLGFDHGLLVAPKERVLGCNWS